MLIFDQCLHKETTLFIFFLWDYKVWLAGFKDDSHTRMGPFRGTLLFFFCNQRVVRTTNLKTRGAQGRRPQIHEITVTRIQNTQRFSGAHILCHHLILGEYTPGMPTPSHRVVMKRPRTAALRCG